MFIPFFLFALLHIIIPTSRSFLLLHSFASLSLSLCRDYMEERSFLYQRQSSKTDSESKRFIHGGFTFQLPKGMRRSPMKMLKHVAGEVARALCLASGNKTTRSSRRKDVSARSKPFVAPLDSQRVEAIEDCIQFINTSLSRSNSTAN